MTLITTCVEDDVRMTWTVEMTFGTDSFASVSTGKGSDGTVHLTPHLFSAAAQLTAIMSPLG